MHDCQVVSLEMLNLRGRLEEFGYFRDSKTQKELELKLLKDSNSELESVKLELFEESNLESDLKSEFMKTNGTND